MERRTVTNKGSYMCCWISFNGAVGGTLRVSEGNATWWTFPDGPGTRSC